MSVQEEDVEMVGDLREIIENSEAVALDVTWNPTAGMYLARVWHETESSTVGDAVNTWMHASDSWLTKVCQASRCDPGSHVHPI